MNFLIVYFIVVFIILCLAVSSAARKKKQSDPSPIVEKNHRWHSPKGEYGENHADRVDNHLYRHPEPEPGYVVLNGVKRKIEDCRYL